MPIYKYIYITFYSGTKGATCTLIAIHSYVEPSKVIDV